MELLDVSSRFARAIRKPLVRSGAVELGRGIALGLSPSWREFIKNWRLRTRALVEAVAQVSGSRYVADSSKVGARLQELKKIEGLNVRVIRLVRDGRAVALTYMNAANYADASDPSLRYGGRGRGAHRDLTMSEAAREWLRSNEEAEALLRSIDPDEVLQIRYEEICGNVEGSLAEIARFLRIDGRDFERNFRDVPNHVVGNGMRLDSSSAVVLDERWKDVLTEKDLVEFDNVAGALNRKYGYGR